MNLDKQAYVKYTKGRAPKSPSVKNTLTAFLVGGFICSIGEILRTLYERYLSLAKDDAATLTSVTLVFVAVLLTAIGLFDKIASHAGAGTLVPITGFANAVASPAIDSRSEGLVLGIGAKIFTVAGPVLLYGILSGAIYGVVYFIASLLSSLL